MPDQRDANIAQLVSHDFTESLCIIFLLTGLRIYTGEYKAQGPKGGHYEGRGLCIRRYRYASQLVRSLLPD